ncbi:MAG: hypothetical protein R3A80_08150 [Bdellovibrionota bacterium]
MRKIYSEAYLMGIQAFIDSDLASLNKYIQKTEHSYERKLLKVRQYMAVSENSKALELCLSVASFPLAAFAEKNFLLATLYFSKRFYEKAAYHGSLALETFQKLSLPERIFKSYYNLSVTYSELRWNDMSKLYLDRAIESATSTEDKLDVMRAKACHHSVNNEYPKAKEVLSEMQELILDLESYDVEMFWLIASDIHIWAKEYPEASRCLSRIKKRVNFAYRERLFTQRTLLDFILIPSQPLTLPKLPKIFTTDSEFFLQLSFLRALQDGDLRSSQAFWNSLCQLRPQVYGASYVCLSHVDKRNAFFQCLDKLRTPFIKAGEVPVLSGKLKVAYESLSLSRVPLRKEEWIEKIWGVPYSTEFDSRFYKLVERLKTKIPQSLLQKNRAYILGSKYN